MRFFELLREYAGLNDWTNTVERVVLAELRANVPAGGLTAGALASVLGSLVPGRERNEAVWALACCGVKEAAPFCLDWLAAAGDPDDRLRAASAAARLGLPEGLAGLEGLYGHPDVSDWVIAELAEVGTPEALGLRARLRTGLTVEDWAQGADVDLLVNFLKARGGSDRPLRLFGCACVRRFWPLLVDGRSRDALQVAERYAEGLADEAGRERAEEAARRAWEALGEQPGDVYAAAELAEGVVAPPNDPRSWGYREGPGDVAARARELSGEPEAESALQAGLLRELFGPLPFRAVEVAPAWLTANGGAAAALARRAYDEYDFEALRVLADALEEAGCSQPDLLGHLRRPAGHARGCWALDLLLGLR